MLYSNPSGIYDRVLVIWSESEAQRVSSELLQDYASRGVVFVRQESVKSHWDLPKKQFEQSSIVIVVGSDRPARTRMLLYATKAGYVTNCGYDDAGENFLDFLRKHTLPASKGDIRSTENVALTVAEFIEENTPNTPNFNSITAFYALRTQARNVGLGDLDRVRTMRQMAAKKTRLKKEMGLSPKPAIVEKPMVRSKSPKFSLEGVQIPPLPAGLVKKLQKLSAGSMKAFVESCYKHVDGHSDLRVRVGMLQAAALEFGFKSVKAEQIKELVLVIEGRKEKEKSPVSGDLEIQA
jgi:hypothetical protein